jgi:hypothetical protein
MALKLSATVRNARLEAIETAIGASAILKLFAGTIPANCAAADAGSSLATLALPADYLAAAAAGVKAKSGTWQDLSADSTGTVTHYRVYASDGTTCHLQGTVTATGGGGDMQVDNTSIATAQNIEVTAFSLTDANA